MSTLKEATIGSTVKVIKLHGAGAVKRHIMDMGITKGCDIFVRKVAPLGDPVEITVRGYELTLRKSEAELIEVDGPAQAPVEEPAAAEEEHPEGCTCEECSAEKPAEEKSEDAE